MSGADGERSRLEMPSARSHPSGGKPLAAVDQVADGVRRR
jgi:hypothetical protein